MCDITSVTDKITQSRWLTSIAGLPLLPPLLLPPFRGLTTMAFASFPVRLLGLSWHGILTQPWNVLELTATKFYGGSTVPVNLPHVEGKFRSLGSMLIPWFNVPFYCWCVNSTHQGQSNNSQGKGMLIDWFSVWCPFSCWCATIQIEKEQRWRMYVNCFIQGISLLLLMCYNSSFTCIWPEV